MERQLGLEKELGQGERIVEHSGRKYQALTGAALLILGIPCVAEPVIRGFASVGFWVEFIVGCMFSYGALWALVLCQKEYVCVTNERILYHRCNFLGKKKKVISYPIKGVSRARLCRTSVMWKNRYDGQVLLKIHNRTRILPMLYNGQYVLDAIRESRDELAAKM